MSTVICVEQLSKAYQLGEFSTGTLSRDIERWWYKLRGKEDPFLKIGEVNDRTQKGGSDVVWSLRDVSFTIEQGDAVGIIGRNGAGKSTLLKLLSRVTTPTLGSIKVKGRIASLLEVGTGFHPELTGRENIFLNGAILGMRQREIRRKFDEIVEFSGVERYIDTPVKRYSSGMYVRLAFAVAAHLESEILIVDEVLAVGDAEFQMKCLGKMGEVSKGQGRTVLFVSHNMGSIASLCNRVMLLDKGFVRMDGDPDACIAAHLRKEGGVVRSSWTNTKRQFPDSAFTITRAALVDPALQPYQAGLVTVGDKLLLSISGDIQQVNSHLKIGYQLLNEREEVLFTCLATDEAPGKWPQLTVGHNTLVTEIPTEILNPGRYGVNIHISIHHERWICNHEQQDLLLSFELEDKSFGHPFSEKGGDPFRIIRPFTVVKESAASGVALDHHTNA